MAGYTKPYVRASNCNYFGNPTVGNLLGIAYVDGQKYEQQDDSGTKSWDGVSYRNTGTFVEVSPVNGGDAEPNLRLSESIWALQVGPLLLVYQGWRTDIDTQMAKGYRTRMHRRGPLTG